MQEGKKDICGVEGRIACIRRKKGRNEVLREWLGGKCGVDESDAKREQKKAQSGGVDTSIRAKVEEIRKVWEIRFLYKSGHGWLLC